MNTKDENQRKLDDYFDQLLLKGIEMPYITGVSKATGVSPATISRYAKAKGFFSFPDMRVNFIKNVAARREIGYREKRFLEFLRNNKEIVIISSPASEPIKNFLEHRLADIGFNIQEDSNEWTWKPRASRLIITMSGESVKADKYFNDKSQCNKLLITCMKTKQIDTVSLSQFMYTKRSNTELFRTILDVITWLNNAIDQLLLERKK